MKADRKLGSEERGREPENAPDDPAAVEGAGATRRDRGGTSSDLPATAIEQAADRLARRRRGLPGAAPGIADQAVWAACAARSRRAAHAVASPSPLRLRRQPAEADRAGSPTSRFGVPGPGRSRRRRRHRRTPKSSSSPGRPSLLARARPPAAGHAAGSARPVVPRIEVVPADAPGAPIPEARATTTCPSTGRDWENGRERVAVRSSVVLDRGRERHEEDDRDLHVGGGRLARGRHGCGGAGIDGGRSPPASRRRRRAEAARPVPGDATAGRKATTATQPCILSLHADDKGACVFVGTQVALTHERQGSAHSHLQERGRRGAGHRGDPARRPLPPGREASRRAPCWRGERRGGARGNGDNPILQIVRGESRLVLREGETVPFASAVDPVTGEVVRVDVAVERGARAGGGARAAEPRRRAFARGSS